MMNSHNNFEKLIISVAYEWPRTAATLPAAVCEWLGPLATHFHVTPKELRQDYYKTCMENVSIFQEIGVILSFCHPLFLMNSEV